MSVSEKSQRCLNFNENTGICLPLNNKYKRAFLSFDKFLSKFCFFVEKSVTRFLQLILAMCPTRRVPAGRCITAQVIWCSLKDCWRQMILQVVKQREKRKKWINKTAVVWMIDSFRFSSLTRSVWICIDRLGPSSNESPLLARSLSIYNCTPTQGISQFNFPL